MQRKFGRILCAPTSQSCSRWVNPFHSTRTRQPFNKNEESRLPICLRKTLNLVLDLVSSPYVARLSQGLDDSVVDAGVPLLSAQIDHSILPYIYQESRFLLAPELTWRWRGFFSFLASARRPFQLAQSSTKKKKLLAPHTHVRENDTNQNCVTPIG